MNGDKELYSEDFEVVNESSFRSPEATPDSEVASNRQTNGFAQSADKNRAASSSLMSHHTSIVGPSVDPYQTFELIHNEHQALKGWLFTNFLF